MPIGKFDSPTGNFDFIPSALHERENSGAWVTE